MKKALSILLCLAMAVALTDGSLADEATGAGPIQGRGDDL